MTTGRPFKVPEMALRVCVIPLAVASLWQMATNRQADDTYGAISFSNLAGFKYSYLIVINAITAAYSVASILLSSVKSLARYDWLVFVLDQVRPIVIILIILFLLIPFGLIYTLYIQTSVLMKAWPVYSRVDP